MGRGYSELQDSVRISERNRKQAIDGLLSGCW